MLASIKNPFTSFLFITSAAAAAIITANDIVTDISLIDNAVNTFRGHVEAYTGAANQTQGPMFVDLANIIASTANADAAAGLVTQPFNVDDSLLIVRYYAKSLGQDIPRTNKALIAKKPVFDPMGEAAGIVLAQETFQKGLDEFSDVLVKMLTAGGQLFDETAQKIHNTLQDGIDAYSS